jgi:hypothetical protein
MPGEQFIEPRGGVVGNATQDVGEPGLRIDIVEFGGADQRVDGRGALAAAIGAGEQPSFAPEGDPAQRPLGGIVGQADAAIVEEAGEGGPALEHVIYRLGGVGMARQPATLGTHPPCEVADQRRDAVLAFDPPVIGRKPVEPGADADLRPGDAEVDLLVFETAPQPLEQDVVPAAALAIHADRDPSCAIDASQRKVPP